MSTSSEDEYSHEEANENKDADLAASDTESDEDVSSDEDDEDNGKKGSDDDEDDEAVADEDDSEDDDKDDSDVDDAADSETTDVQSKSKDDLIAEKIVEKYEQRHGKQLYIRFPHKLPEDEAEFQAKVHELSPLIVKGHKPRQKHARFCLVDFKSLDDRNAALQSIRAAIKKDPDSKLVVSLPRTENDNFVQELVQRKLKSLENKRAKSRMKRASKLALRAKNFTSTIVVLNLPQGATVTELRKLYSNAVDVQMKAGRGNMNGRSVAVITMPSTTEARAAFKQKHTLNGTPLKVRFDMPKLKKPQTKANGKSNKVSKNNADTEQLPEKKRPNVKSGAKQQQKSEVKVEAAPVKKAKHGHVGGPPAKKLKNNVEPTIKAKKPKVDSNVEPPAMKPKVLAANASAQKQRQKQNTDVKLKQKRKTKSK